jgi:predicted XRE-type DNA-binding protein
MSTRTSAARLAKQVGIPKSRALEAVLKARLIAAVVREVGRRGMTHVELAARSGLPRSAVTGILSGSLQKVTIDRVLRLVEAAGLEAEIRVWSGVTRYESEASQTVPSWNQLLGWLREMDLLRRVEAA